MEKEERFVLLVLNGRSAQVRLYGSINYILKAFRFHFLLVLSLQAIILQLAATADKLHFGLG